MTRIGIRIFRNHREDKHPMIGRRSEVYDIDTGETLPSMSADIHIDCNNLVMATVELEISDIEIVEVD